MPTDPQNSYAHLAFEGGLASESATVTPQWAQGGHIVGMSTPEEEAFETHAERVLREIREPYGPRRILPRTAGALDRRAKLAQAATARRKAERARVRTCPVCNTVFQGASTRAVYCTRRCEARTWTLAQGYVTGPRTHICGECQEPFTASKAGTRYCGGTCRPAARARAERQRRRDAGGTS